MARTHHRRTLHRCGSLRCFRSSRCTEDSARELEAWGRERDLDHNSIILYHNFILPSQAPLCLYHTWAIFLAPISLGPNIGCFEARFLVGVSLVSQNMTQISLVSRWGHKIWPKYRCGLVGVTQYDPNIVVVSLGSAWGREGGRERGYRGNIEGILREYWGNIDKYRRYGRYIVSYRWHNMTQISLGSRWGLVLVS